MLKAVGPASLPSGGRRLEAVGNGGGLPPWILDDNCPDNIKCGSSADCEGLTIEDIEDFFDGRKLSELEAERRKLQPGPPGPPNSESYIRMVCIHGLAPLAFIEDGPPLRQHRR